MKKVIAFTVLVLSLAFLGEIFYCYFTDTPLRKKMPFLASIINEDMDYTETNNPVDYNAADAEFQNDNGGMLTTTTSKSFVEQTLRDNTPRVYVPTKSGVFTYNSPDNTFHMDTSNAEEGYIVINYTGSNPKPKMMITGKELNTYTYTIIPFADLVIPLTSGASNYQISFFEQIEGQKYRQNYSLELPLVVKNQWTAFLYPNYYVEFNQDSQCVKIAQELAQNCFSDVDVIKNVYYYVIRNISYDYEMAADLKTDYIAVPDRTVQTKKGVCIDYACLMASMLRSQGIPTKVEVGYCDEVYHAWVSIYSGDEGWINGIFRFDGKSWSLIDPSIVNTEDDRLFDKIYYTKYVY